jgi:hypothetical protein
MIKYECIVVKYKIAFLLAASKFLLLSILQPIELGQKASGLPARYWRKALNRGAISLFCLP